MLYPNNGKRKDAEQNTDAPYKGYSVSTELKSRISTIVPMSKDDRGVQPSNNTGVKDTKNPEGEDPVVFVIYVNKKLGKINMVMKNGTSIMTILSVMYVMRNCIQERKKLKCQN